MPIATTTRHAYALLRRCPMGTPAVRTASVTGDRTDGPDATGGCIPPGRRRSAAPDGRRRYPAGAPWSSSTPLRSTPAGAGTARSLNTPVLISVSPSTGKTKPHLGQRSWRTACSWVSS